MKTNAFRSISFALICMILGILIALQMKNVNLMNLSQSNLDDLQNQIIEYADKNAELVKRNTDLDAVIDSLTNEMASGNEQISTIIKEKERAAIFAGLREVKKYGFQIQISCAEGVEVKDTVLFYLLNELRAIGAQALSVNDERIVAMSEIRSVSNTSSIYINGNRYSSQDVFTIKAITNPKKEEAIKKHLAYLRDQIVMQFEDSQYDIQFTPMQELTIPALSEDSTAFKIDLLMPAE